ncbi:Acetate kinase [[Actinomadura] parvosata subsp. kistnae]|nr:Acetate kinase [Actinomadura parvosata subsp. kistnae]
MGTIVEPCPWGKVKPPHEIRLRGMASPILVLNTGSSSIKYELIDPRTRERSAKGLVERIGEERGG